LLDVTWGWPYVYSLQYESKVRQTSFENQQIFVNSQFKKWDMNFASKSAHET